jgi:hypothetical protein
LKEHERVVVEGTQNMRNGGPVREQGQEPRAPAEQKT